MVNKISIGRAQGATTRYLTRIITYLSDTKNSGSITNISMNCFSGDNRTVRDALQWLVSNKIIIITYNDSAKIYKINPKFIKLRNENKEGTYTH